MCKTRVCSAFDAVLTPLETQRHKCTAASQNTPLENPPLSSVTHPHFQSLYPSYLYVRGQCILGLLNMHDVKIRNLLPQFIMNFA